MKLSIIIPVYNENKTINKLLRKVNSVKLDFGIKKEVIVVDDGSIDGTKEILDKIKDNNIIKNYRFLSHSENMGKGAAIKTGLVLATGDIILIQDADLEYNTNDYNKLIEPIITGKANIVYGSRNIGRVERLYWSFYLGNLFLSWLANLLYGIKITDEATCYKVFKRDILEKISLKAKRFEFCPEVTAKVAKKGYQIFEVPISYEPRSMEEGKKIKWKDGFIAIWTLVKYRFVD